MFKTPHPDGPTCLRLTVPGVGSATDFQHKIVMRTMHAKKRASVRGLNRRPVLLGTLFILLTPIENFDYFFWLIAACAAVNKGRKL